LARAFGKAEPANHHLQSVQIDIGGSGGVEQHLQDRWHAVGERHALTLDQFDQHRRLVASGIDLLDAGERRGPGEAPGVDVKHRCDRHVDVVARKTSLHAGHAEQSQP
jgi:hypothetical protein